MENISKVDSSISYRYWQRFKKSNRNRIVSKKGKKFEVDYQNWYICTNLMNDNIKNEIIIAGITM